MRRRSYSCSRCDRAWSGFDGSLCPACGGEPGAKDEKIRLVSGQPADNWKDRTTRPLSDENGPED